MSAEPQLFRINPQNNDSKKIMEVDFAQLGLKERRDIQEWVADNPSILDEDSADYWQGIQWFRQSQRKA